MRDVLKLCDVLSDIVESGGAGATAASRLLHWAQAQSAAAEAGAVDNGNDDADEANDAGDAGGDARRQQQRPQQQQQHHQQQQQQQLTGGSISSSSGGAMWQPQLLPRAGLEQRDQWAFRRRSGAFHKQQCGAGNAPGTREALHRYSTLSMICCAPGCSALVDYKVARRQAKQAGRLYFMPGDGCAGLAPCSVDHRAARFAQRQRKQAAELEAGDRLLVCWPAGLDEREVWYYPREAACEAAAVARGTL